jgi:hypothetical protein
MLARELALRAQIQVRDGQVATAVASLREGLEYTHINSNRPSIATCPARGAVVMAALGEHETAAVFLGAVTSSVLARRSGVSPNEVPDYNKFVATLRTQLGEDLCTAATARGAAMTYEQANAFALAVVARL